MANATTPGSHAAARAPSPSTSTSSRRFSSKGRFLKKFFRRLIPPFSPSSSSSSHPSRSEGTSSTDTATTKSNTARDDEQQSQAPTGEKMGYQAAAPSGIDKENEAPPSPAALDDSVARLSLEKRPNPAKPAVFPVLKLTADGLKSSAPKTQSHHQEFMDQALDMARLALRTNETPVGCVLVHKNKVIAKGMNATNVTRNGTRHAEFMAISALLSYRPEGELSDNSLAEPRHIPTAMSAEAAAERQREKDAELGPDPSLNDSDYVKSGHLYPYGQKIHTDARVPRHIINECVLYVTVEPCVMCAGLLRQLGIQKVFFGAVNDKFGGAGGVFSIHLNSIRPQDLAKRAAEEEANKKKDTKLPLGALANGQTPSRSNSMQGQDKVPQKMSSGQYHQPLSNPDGDGGNVERGFEIEGGWGRDEAIGLLRRFYVQENGRAPQPRKKEGRAARLAAMEQGVELPAAELPTGATPNEVADGNTSAEADKTALDAEIAEIPLTQEPILEGKK